MATLSQHTEQGIALPVTHLGDVLIHLTAEEAKQLYFTLYSYDSKRVVGNKIWNKLNELISAGAL